MAKYDWKQLEKEYILGDYKSVSSFLRSKNISFTGNTNKQTKGWNKKKATKEQQKSNKIVEKVIEKQSDKEAEQIVNMKSIANDLAINLIKANQQLEQYIVKKKNKKKTVKYNYKVGKPQEETIDETEEIQILDGIVDRKGLKMLTSALKDLNEIIGENKDQNEVEDLTALAKLLGVDKDG